MWLGYHKVVTLKKQKYVFNEIKSWWETYCKIGRNNAGNLIIKYLFNN